MISMEQKDITSVKIIVEVTVQIPEKKPCHEEIYISFYSFYRSSIERYQGIKSMLVNTHYRAVESG